MRPVTAIRTAKRRILPPNRFYSISAIIAVAVVFWSASIGIISFADSASKPRDATHSGQPVEKGQDWLQQWCRQWLSADDAKPFEIVTIVITAGGFIVTIWSILKLTEQTTLVADTLRQNAIDCITTQAAEANKLFIEHPDLRRFFYDNDYPASDHGEYHRVQAIAEYLLDYFDSVLSQIHYFPKVWKSHHNDIDSWESYIKDVFRTSPTLRWMLGEKKDWYGRSDEKWRNIVNLYDEVNQEKLPEGREVASLSSHPQEDIAPPTALLRPEPPTGGPARGPS